MLAPPTRRSVRQYDHDAGHAAWLLFVAKVSRQRGGRTVLLATTFGMILYPALSAATPRIELIILYAGIAGFFQGGLDLVFFDQLMKTVPRNTARRLFHWPSPCSICPRLSLHCLVHGWPITLVWVRVMAQRGIALGGLLIVSKTRCQTAGAVCAQHNVMECHAQTRRYCVRRFHHCSLSPILLLIAILIRIDSPGPILYLPQMVGQHGKKFSLWRFRTMTANRTNSGSEQLTPLGRFLRNYSLDHLPMLINLLKGDLTSLDPARWKSM